MTQAAEEQEVNLAPDNKQATEKAAAEKAERVWMTQYGVTLVAIHRLAERYDFIGRKEDAVALRKMILEMEKDELGDLPPSAHPPAADVNNPLEFDLLGQVADLMKRKRGENDALSLRYEMLHAKQRLKSKDDTSAALAVRTLESVLERQKAKHKRSTATPVVRAQLALAEGYLRVGLVEQALQIAEAAYNAKRAKYPNSPLKTIKELELFVECKCRQTADHLPPGHKRKLYEMTEQLLKMLAEKSGEKSRKWQTWSAKLDELGRALGRKR